MASRPAKRARVCKPFPDVSFRNKAENKFVSGFSLVDDGLPSVGSAGHADLTCRPCAFSWKANGCSKGRDCDRCHICGEEEYRNWRMNMKGTALDARKPNMAPQGSEVQEEWERDGGGHSLPSIGSAGHATSTCRPCAHVWRPNGCTKGRNCERCHICGEAEYRWYRMQIKAQQKERRGFADTPANRESQVPLWEEDFEAENEVESDMLPSVGSAGHVNGTCLPCGYVWKDGGCSKGRDCERCHICGEREYREYRRAVKGKGVPKARPASIPTSIPTSRPTMAAHLQAELAESELDPFSLLDNVRGDNVEEEEPEEEEDDGYRSWSRGMGGQAFADAPWSRGMGGQGFADAPATGESQVPSGKEESEVEHEVESNMLPSVGSAGHAAGTCRPCAHVWRENGCIKGIDCERCHICGEAEYRWYRTQIKAQKAQRGGGAQSAQSRGVQSAERRGFPRFARYVRPDYRQEQNDLLDW